ncbi:MAG: hypothetical protein IPI37_04745 [Bacteroidales bacterium]|nr:hypothetical protein [Bacteroidales bacterium]
MKLVGDTTHGKPAGIEHLGISFPSDAVPKPDYKYVFAPITFEYLNSDDQGRFYDGIKPDVRAADDITHDFGDPEEASCKHKNLLEGKKSVTAEPVRRPTIWSEGNQLPHRPHPGSIESDRSGNDRQSGRLIPGIDPGNNHQ